MVHMSTEDTRQYAGPPPPPPPSSPPPRGYPPLSAIRRSRTDKHLAGVSGGLARYAGIDPLIIRILFVVLTFFGGTGVLLYAVGWLLLPIEGENESEGQRLLHGRSGPSTLRTVIAGIVAVIVGLILISNLFDEGPGLGGLGAVVVVAAVIVLVARNGQRPPYDAAAQPMYGPVPPPEPGAYGQTPGTAYATATPPAGAATVPPVGPPPQTATWTMPAQPPPPPAPPKERSILGLMTFSATLVVVGLMIGWNVISDGVGNDFTAVAILASALAVVGIGLVVGAFVGRAYGVIWLGILLSIATSLTAVAANHFDEGVGERTWVVNSAADADREFRLGIGEADLDLTGLSADEDVRVDVRVGVGDLLVLVPEDARVVVDAEAGAGQLRILDEELVDGTDLRKIVTDAPPGAAGPDIRIDAEIGLGEVEVRRETP